MSQGVTPSRARVPSLRETHVRGDVTECNRADHRRCHTSNGVYFSDMATQLPLPFPETRRPAQVVKVKSAPRPVRRVVRVVGAQLPLPLPAPRPVVVAPVPRPVVVPVPLDPSPRLVVAALVMLAGVIRGAAAVLAAMVGRVAGAVARVTVARVATVATVAGDQAWTPAPPVVVVEPTPPPVVVVGPAWWWGVPLWGDRWRAGARAPGAGEAPPGE